MPFLAAEEFRRKAGRKRCETCLEIEKIMDIIWIWIILWIILWINIMDNIMDNIMNNIMDNIVLGNLILYISTYIYI